MNKLTSLSRIIIAIVALALIATYFLPVWFIYLIAPQYPEGLTMNIWLNKLSGQVDIINGLNHYIGMKHIKEDMFPEFKYMVYIMGFFIAFGLLVAATGRRSLLLVYNILFILAALAAMYDFYQWGYDYGHNLDPTAAIQIPGFSYQPPLFGHKTLLNFDAYSYPDIGGWVIISAALICFIIYLIEWRKNRKVSVKYKARSKNTVTMAAAFLCISLSACNSGPEAFEYGKDSCADCKMTIVEPKFGAEIISNKGRIYKFDDAHCILNFMKNKVVEQSDIKSVFFINYEKHNDFLDAEQIHFVVSPKFKSPMNSNAAAFPDKASAEKTAIAVSGEIKTWKELQSAQH